MLVLPVLRSSLHTQPKINGEPIWRFEGSPNVGWSEPGRVATARHWRLVLGTVVHKCSSRGSDPPHCLSICAFVHTFCIHLSKIKGIQHPFYIILHHFTRSWHTTIPAKEPSEILQTSNVQPTSHCRAFDLPSWSYCTNQICRWDLRMAKGSWFLFNTKNRKRGDSQYQLCSQLNGTLWIDAAFEMHGPWNASRQKCDPSEASPFAASSSPQPVGSRSASAVAHRSADWGRPWGPPMARNRTPPEEILETT